MFHFLTNLKIDLQRTLFTGQTFLWTRHLNEYYYVLHDNLISLKATDTGIYFKIHYTLDNLSQKSPLVIINPNYNESRILEVKHTKDKSTEYQSPVSNKRIKFESNELISKVRRDLHVYFHLDIDLEALVEEWDTDSIFKSKTKNIKYCRMLNQDPLETIFQFICSQNNNIKRITQLCQTINSFGSYLGTIDGKHFHRFPTLEQLSLKTEQDLRDFGFGYRAKYIEKTCRFLLENPTFIDDLLLKDYKDAKIDLLSLHGVGPKVADCICLFGLDKRDCIPVDTHVWKIATVDYKMNIKKLTTKTYEEIGDFFRKRFTYAGWAHTLLFVGDLKSDSLGNQLELEQKEE